MTNAMVGDITRGVASRNVVKSCQEADSRAIRGPRGRETAAGPLDRLSGGPVSALGVSPAAFFERHGRFVIGYHPVVRGPAPADLAVTDWLLKPHRQNSYTRNRRDTGRIGQSRFG